MKKLGNIFKSIGRYLWDARKKRPRFRTILLIWGSIAVLAALFATDPDKSKLSTIFFGLQIVTPLVAVCAAHFTRKAIFDYPESNPRVLFQHVLNGNIAAGLGLLAIAIVFSALIFAFVPSANAADVKTYIPAGAKVYCPVLIDKQKELWPDHPQKEVLCALVEHESCVTLTSKRCWSPTSQLKTEREEGAGFGQLTRAYNKDGSTRFDAIAEVSGQHPALRELSWDNVYHRPDLQLIAILLKNRGDFIYFDRLLTRKLVAVQMADAAWNGGRGGVQNERRACGLTKGCDPQQWFGHVELVCLKSKKPLYAGRSACDINRHHVRDVILTRAPKYKKFLQV
jgi:hypothetical protein